MISVCHSRRRRDGTDDDTFEAKMLFDLDTGLGIGLSSLEALLGLLEVDDRPDVLEVVCRIEGTASGCE